MTWVKIDDGFLTHPKAIKAGKDGRALFFAALIYSSRELTDGFIDDSAIPILGAFAEVKNGVAVADLLVRIRLFDREEDGYRIHDYLDYNPSREEVDAARGIAKRRAAMNADPELGRAIKARDGDLCRYCGRFVSWRDRKSPHGGTYDHVTPLGKGGDESIDNLVVSCRDCNVRKGMRSPAEAGLILLDPPTEIEKESGRHLDGIQHRSRQPGTRNPVPVPVPKGSKEPSRTLTRPAITEDWLDSIQPDHPTVDVREVLRDAENRKTWDGYKDKRRSLLKYVGWAEERATERVHRNGNGSRPAESVGWRPRIDVEG